MSVTTTDNARIITVRHVLADYDLHHSQPEDSAATPAPAPNAHPPPSDAPGNNPPGWEDGWRRVPAFRPVNQQLDEQRNTYTSETERNFIRLMLGGVLVTSTASHVWRATGGKLNSAYFKFKVGGEW